MLTDVRILKFGRFWPFSAIIILGAGEKSFEMSSHRRQTALLAQKHDLALASFFLAFRPSSFLDKNLKNTVVQPYYVQRTFSRFDGEHP